MLTTHPPFSAEVKNEQELYLLSPHALSWRVAGSIKNINIVKYFYDFKRLFGFVTCPIRFKK
jgi:hypothetical protein